MPSFEKFDTPSGGGTGKKERKRSHSMGWLEGLLDLVTMGAFSQGSRERKRSRVKKK